MKNQMKQLFRLALIGAMLITSCKKEDLKDQNQNLINRMKSVTDLSWSSLTVQFFDKFKFIVLSTPG